MKSSVRKKQLFSIPIFFLFCLMSFAQQTALLKPTYLKKGDTVAIVAPAGIVRDSVPINSAIQWLKSWGLHVKLGKYVYNNEHQFSGTDAERTLDLQTALDNKNIKAIWCARGGYGTGRIIDNLILKFFLKIQNGLLVFPTLQCYIATFTLWA